MGTRERIPGGQERGLENIGQTASERSKELQERDKRVEEGPENREHRANVEREHIESLFGKEQGGGERKAAHMDSSGDHVATKKQRQTSYKHTMKRIQSEMSPQARVFSKVIHNPVIEKTSETIGATIARPNAVLAGSFCAFALVIVVYGLATNSGYRLSGFETIGAFILGWIIGIVYDFLRRMISGKST